MTNKLDELVKTGEWQALGHDAELQELDIVEHTRTRKDGSLFRLYFKVWAFPYGVEHGNRGRRYEFSGWRVFPVDEIKIYGFSNQGETVFSFVKCDDEKTFAGRLSSGVTNIYRMAE